MRIGVFGTGGVGGYFGGLLAKAGHEVTFVARGEHFRAINSQGLQIKSVNGDFKVYPAKVTQDPKGVGPLEYVILAVKYYQLQDALPSLSLLVGSETTIIPLLNGVDVHDHLIKAFGAEKVVGGLCSLVSMIESPGVIRQETKLRRVVLGELNCEKSDRVESIVQAWRESGAEAIHADDIHVAMWTKFLFISSFGGVSSLSRATAGELIGCAETTTLLVHAMKEVESIARTQNIDLRQDVVETTISFMHGLEPSATSSMQRDVADGKPFELEAFSGTIVRLGDEFEVPTPINDTIYALLLPALQRAMSE